MKAPVIFVKGLGSDTPIPIWREYEEVYCSYKRDSESGKIIPESYRRMFVAHWLHHLIMLPENIWRYILCRLWLDRLTFQYERGYAAGLREALSNYETYKNLTPEELAGVLAEPPHEEY